jgi:hypothetical protein
VKPAVKAIKDRRNLYAALSVAAMLLTVLLLIKQKMEAAIACGGLTAVALMLLYRQSRLMGAAMLICDSKILTVPSFVVIFGEPDKGETQAEETIVSTFGLLLGNKVYRWGCEGVYGVRLTEGTNRQSAYLPVLRSRRRNVARPSCCTV